MIVLAVDGVCVLRRQIKNSQENQREKCKKCKRVIKRVKLINSGVSKGAEEVWVIEKTKTQIEDVKTLNAVANQRV